MTYAGSENSVESGTPIELFEFTLGAETFRFTSSADEVTVGGVTYAPAVIGRDDLKVSPAERTEVLTIGVDARLDFVRRYINGVPGQAAQLLLQRMHRTDGSQELRPIFRGTVRSVAFTENGVAASIAVLPVSGRLANALPRFLYSSLCNHVLFDSACGLSAASFKFSGTVSAISDNTLTVTGLGAAKPNGWANAGYVVTSWGDYRMILSHVGSDIRLMIPFTASPVGGTVDVYAGCDHSIDTCGTKFSNRANFGGFAYVPKRNPFTGGIQ